MKINIDYKKSKEEEFIEGIDQIEYCGTKDHIKRHAKTIAEKINEAVKLSQCLDCPKEAFNNVSIAMKKSRSFDSVAFNDVMNFFHFDPDVKINFIVEPSKNHPKRFVLKGNFEVEVMECFSYER